MSAWTYRSSNGNAEPKIVPPLALSRRKQGFESPRERHVIASTVAIAGFFFRVCVTRSQCLCKFRRFLFSLALRRAQSVNELPRER
jgi:hypothetical protein